MHTFEYAHDLSKAIDEKRYKKLIKSLGPQLNDRKDRFDKADIIEQSIEVYSNGRLKWVDDIGRDHHDTKLGLDIEFKYASNSIITKTGKLKDKIKVKIKNSLGSHKGVKIEDPADYYIIGQENAMVIISYTDLEPQLVAVPDGIEAHITDGYHFIMAPEEDDIGIKEAMVSYKEQKKKMQKMLIESI